MKLLAKIAFAAFYLFYAVFAGNAEPKHGIAIIGEPALQAGFAHLPYANPDCATRRADQLRVAGTFDNVNPFILKSMRTTARGRSIRRSEIWCSNR